MGKALHLDIEKENKILSNTEQDARLQRIGMKVAAVADRQDYVYKFYLIEKDELNAFTTPGGNIYIHSGLMNKLSTDDQVAAVLAHEIGHSSARHTVKKFQAAMGYDIISSIVFNQLNLQETSQQLATLGSDFLMNVAFSAYGRQDEFEADRLGVKYMHLSGYNPQASVEVLTILKQEIKDTGGVPLFLRSHPYLEDRIAATKNEVAQLSSQ
jgi:predicted Zn-dependent protease